MTGAQLLRAGSADVCADRIRHARQVLVVCHVDPDGDALGSMLGLGWLLQSLNIPHSLACSGPVPGSFDFLPRTTPVISECDGGDYDLVVSVDCNDCDRLGRFCHCPQLTDVQVVNIDHHVTNPLFGAVNWVDSEAAATAEMIFELAACLDAAFSPEAATCLLAGIVTDTQGFRTPNTTVRTMEAALVLMRAGADLSEIVARTLDSRSFASMALWAKVISNARLQDGVVWAEVRLADMRDCGTGREGPKGLINYLLSAREARVVVLITETEDEVIDVSLRAAPGFEVSSTAVRLGGGGHPQAAGCTMKVPIAEARSALRTVLKQSLREQGLKWSGTNVPLS